MTISTLWKRFSIPTLLIGIAIGIGTATGAGMLGSSTFPDVEQGSYYDAAVGRLNEADIVKGYPDGTFKPGNTVNRAEVTVMIDRLRNEVLGIDEDEPSTPRSSRARSSSERSEEQNSSVSSSMASSSKSSQASMTSAGAFRFTSNNFTVAENVSTVVVTVVRIGGNKGTTNVTYTVANGTATAGSDFVAATGTLNFPNGTTSQNFTVQITDDANNEGSETATLTLSDPTNSAILTSPSTATVTITDNESASSASGGAAAGSAVSSNPAGNIAFAATAYNVNENAGSLTVTLLRNGGTTGAVNVNYGTSNGTANSGTNYTATSGTMTFNAGESSKSFSVPILDNGGIAGAKTFTIILSSPTGGAGIESQSQTTTVSISDDESMTYGSGSFKFSKTSYDVTEGQGYAAITVQRTGGSQGTATIAYEVTIGTANPGQDFTATNGTLTFAPGESSKIFKVPVIKDSQSDSGEAANLYIMNPSGAALGSPSNATLWIYD